MREHAFLLRSPRSVLGHAALSSNSGDEDTPSAKHVAIGWNMTCWWTQECSSNERHAAIDCHHDGEARTRVLRKESMVRGRTARRQAADSWRSTLASGFWDRPPVLAACGCVCGGGLDAQAALPEMTFQDGAYRMPMGDVVRPITDSRLANSTGSSLSARQYVKLTHGTFA
jgi:hypothetical protein